jgi:hypothetical protein
MVTKISRLYGHREGTGKERSEKNNLKDETGKHGNGRPQRRKLEEIYRLMEERGLE